MADAGVIGHDEGTATCTVPHPSGPARAQAPDFSYLQISAAGALARPEVTAALTDIEYLATGMVRVLDENHAAVGAWHPHLESDELQVGLRHMLLTRLFRPAHADHPAPGPDFVLPAFIGGRRPSRWRRRWRCVRMTCCFLPIATSGFADRARPQPGRPHVPVPVEHARHVQGPPAAGHVSLAVRQYLFHFRQPRDSISAGGRLGDGVGSERRGSHRRGVDRRGQQRRGGTFITASPSRPCTGRR